VGFPGGKTASYGSLAKPDTIARRLVRLSAHGDRNVWGVEIARNVVVPVGSARSRFLNSVTRFGACLGTAGALLLAANVALQNASAEGDTRTLTFHHMHTGEDITVTFKRDGRYDDAALQKLDWFMRDWRKAETTHMDPHLYDVLWEAYRELGASKPIEVVCGYRSPVTNAMLRGRSKKSGVAERSEHTLGHAMDFYIPGVSLEKLREIGLRLQAGGVGFYPTSGSPFVHMDTGTIRHWPRMTYTQLARVFPDGKTVHVASDGRPLPHFAEALADVEARGKAPNHISLEQARAHGVITEQQVQTAELTAQSGQPRAQQPNLLAALFGGGRSETAAHTNASAPQQATRVRVASADASSIPVRSERVRVPVARPKAADVAQAKAPVPAALMAYASADGMSVGGALAEEILALKSAPADAPVKGALKYAYAASDDFALVRGETWGVAPKQPAPPAPVAPVSVVQTSESAQTTTVIKAGEPALEALPGINLWLRAAILTPSVSGELTVTQFGPVDQLSVRDLLYKPTDAVAMSFSDQPSLQTDRFTGGAVVFLSKAQIKRAQTASLELPTTR
jgi:uncharacterized protein YcbK (DUF882 family)